MRNEFYKSAASQPPPFLKPIMASKWKWNLKNK